MLEVLRISNYAIIDNLSVEFSSGLTVLTGETGAGKSIILGAFRLLLGERATGDLVRAGSKRASIEGLFRSLTASVDQWINDNGFASDEVEDNNRLLLRREIISEGSSRNFINGKSATVAQLKELGIMLVDMHGQNDHTSLHSPSVQLRVLDSFGNYSNELTAYQSAFSKWRMVRDRFETLSMVRGDEERRRDFLQFQIDEIRQSDLKSGEENDLEQERRRLGNAERLCEICSDACDILFDGEKNENPAVSQISQAGRMLQELGKLDQAQESFAVEAESIRFSLEDLVERIRDYSESVAGDPQRLDQVENRLDLIRTLKRKYGSSIDDIIALEKSLSVELNDIVNKDSQLEEVRTQLLLVEEKAWETGRNLSEARAKAARRFEKHVQDNMRELELPKAVLNIHLDHTEKDEAHGIRPQFSPTGLDTCEFLVSLNLGESVKPMRKIASGGEISRIMLAIKSVLAHRDNVPTLVFDEIDTGISGQAATKVGEKLESLAKSHQIMCITHLPQVAARGTRHLVVAKHDRNGRTTTDVQEVSGEDRTLALARMLSGAKVDETSRKFAESLLIK